MDTCYDDDNCDEAELDEQDFAVRPGQKFGGAYAAPGHKRYTSSDKYWQEDSHEYDPNGSANPCYQTLCGFLSDVGFGVDLRLNNQREDEKPTNPDRCRNQVGKPQDGPSVDHFVLTSSSFETVSESRSIFRGFSAGLL